MKIYLVEDRENAPGRILACFANENDAVAFANMLDTAASIDERTLFYGQPPVRGFNE